MDEGVDKAVASADADAGQEDGDAHFAQHKVGAGRGVGHQTIARAETTDEDGDDERAASQTELDGPRYAGQ